MNQKLKRRYPIECAQCVSGITEYPQNRMFGKSNNLKVYWSNITKGLKPDGQNRLRSPMPEGG
jgi:hypothetical protein